MIGKDKIYHFIAGLLIALISQIFVSFLISMIIVIIIGLIKELYDEYKYGGFDMRDLMATILGGLITIIL